MLSISIPVHNFAHVLPETLDSIVTQERSSDVEILVFDGGSTDNTAEIMEKYKYYFSNIRYERRPLKGGIDLDMATSVTKAKGDYVWLFSGDDWMLPGALSLALEYIKGDVDLYLTRHLEWRDFECDWITWPTINAKQGQIFNLSNPACRVDYFRRAQTTEAFFSFIGGIIVKRYTWEKTSVNKVFIGSCWAHVARLFQLMPNGLTVQPITEPLVKRRPDNDSFSSNSIIKRFALTIDGFTEIASHYFGPKSIESREIRRVLRNEYHPLTMMLGKYLCFIDPQHEDHLLMNKIFNKIYCENTFECLKAKFNYARLSPELFRRWQPELSAKYDLIKQRSS